MDNSDLTKIYDAITKKKAKYNILNAYYDGDQPILYLTQRLREIFKGIDTVFTENWCAVVINSCLDRINLNGFKVNDKAVQDELDRVWNDNDLMLESDDIHSATLVNGEAFLIIWPNEDGFTEVYFNDPRMVEVVYDPSYPRKKLVAGKMFEAGDGTARITLYYPDRLEYYETKQKIKDVTSSKSFQPILDGENWPVNPYGEIPVFHFKLNRRIISDLKNIIPLQNVTNKLLSDMVVAAEFGAYKQRWVISNSDTQGMMTSQPGSVIELPAGDGIGQPTSVGEFMATDLKNYLDAIDNLAGAIGKISGTPKHYFYNQGGDPSGEALIAMESPLNKKASARIERFGTVWKQVAAFIALVAGKVIDRNDITPVFDEPETVQPKTEADITKTRTDSGVPLVTALRWEGKTQAEIDAMIKDQKTQKSESTAMAQALLEDLRLKQEQSNNPYAPGKLIKPPLVDETTTTPTERGTRGEKA